MNKTSESITESAILSAGKTAPRITPAHIDSIISSVHYFTAEEGRYGALNNGAIEAASELDDVKQLGLLTFCVLVLANGFTVTGESACASPENFDPVIGKSIAYDNARNKIWMIEGYLLKQKLYENSQVLTDSYAKSHLESIARMAHEVNRGYCQSIGDNSQPAWHDAPVWQRDSAINGVKFHLTNEATPEESHASWLKQKHDEGWKHGPVKDVDKKEHPCFCLYSELPQEQRAKDYLFRAVVNSFN